MPWNPPATFTSGQLVTAAHMNGIRDSLEFLEEVAYQEFISSVSVTATTVGTANQIVSAGAITFESVPHFIEFDVPRVSSINADVNVILRDGTTVLGTLEVVATGGPSRGLTLRRRLTPTAASHTYNVAAWLGAADTVLFDAGTGGTAGNATTFLPGFIRITRIPT